MTAVADDATVVIPTPVETDDATVVMPAPVVTTPGRWPAQSRDGRRPPVPRKKKDRTDLWLAGGLTALVLVLLAWNITGFPSASDDEGTYLAQSWAVQHGLGLAHYTYWYDHPPLGWIQLAGLAWLPAAVAPGMLAVAGGRIAMLPVEAVSLLLVYLICRRLGFRRWAASLALLVFGLSPLSVTMNRQIYLDSFAVAWILAAFALSLSPRKHLWHHAAAGFATAVAVLSKETMLIVAPAVVVAMWQNTRATTTRAWAFGAYASGLVLVGVFYPLYAVLRGELFPGAGHVSLVGAWEFQLASRSGSGSIFDAGSNSSSLLHSWLYYDGVILVGGLAATVIALAFRRLRAPAVAAAILTVVALRPGGYLPAMYVVQVLPFFAIVLAGVVELGIGDLSIAKLGIGNLSIGQLSIGKRDARRRAAHWAALALALAAAVYVVPHWYVGDRRAMVTNDNRGYEQAAAWLRTGVGDRPGTTIVVDDVLWLDCVRAGYQPDKVIWFYKLDLDPAVAKRLPDGWRDVDYIVSTPALRQDPTALPTVSALLQHSSVVASFGPDGGRIEIRRVEENS